MDVTNLVKQDTFLSKIPELEEVEKDNNEFEYGKLESSDHQFISHYDEKEDFDYHEYEPPIIIYIMTYISYLILVIIGHVRDFFGKIFKPRKYEHLMEMDGYAAWNDGFESFYVRRLKERIDDCFARLIHGVPGRYIQCFDKSVNKSSCTETLKKTSFCLNLASYNYLGFAQSKGSCTKYALKCVERYGTSGSSPRSFCGTTNLHVFCENLVADFVGKDDAIIVSQGYGTNAFLFMCLADSLTLVISDELNHASIRFGIRLSSASVKVFKHNDMVDLELILRNQIAHGQPRTHKPWKKIIVVVEGLYSMEGTMCNLPKLTILREKYKFYLFVDEAHSIGAIGPNGRGVCDYFNISPKKVDILMGTFTKSFGAAGGYIAAEKSFINKLRLNYVINNLLESIAPPVIAQIIASLSIIKGIINPGEGIERLQRICFNSRYLRLGLRKLGFIVYGSINSPVIPLMIYLPGKMPTVSRMLYSMKIAVVIVSYPATPLISARVRICVSSALTKKDLDLTLKKFSEIGDLIYLKFNCKVLKSLKIKRPSRFSINEVLSTNVNDCKKSF